MTGSLSVAVESIGVIGPGLPDWPTAAAIFEGRRLWQDSPAAIPAAQRLPAPERRRVGGPVKLALGVAEQVFAASRVRPDATATVFTSSSGDGDNCHALTTGLAEPDPVISPTRFTNSVHNTASGYWSIAVGAMAPTTTLCAHDASFAAGLLEAAMLACAEGVPVALIAYEFPYPEPILSARPIRQAFGAGLLLWPVDPAGVSGADPRRRGANDPLDTPLAWLEIGALRRDAVPDPATPPVLEALRAGVPAARSLPLLARIARREAGEVLIEAHRGQVLPVRVRV